MHPLPFSMGPAFSGPGTYQSNIYNEGVFGCRIANAVDT